MLCKYPKSKYPSDCARNCMQLNVELNQPLLAPMNVKTHAEITTGKSVMAFHITKYFYFLYKDLRLTLSQSSAVAKGKLRGSH